MYTYFLHILTITEIAQDDINLKTKSWFLFICKKNWKYNFKMTYTFFAPQSHRYLNFRTDFFVQKKKNRKKLFDPKISSEKPDLGDGQKIGSFKLLSLFYASSNKFPKIGSRHFLTFSNNFKCQGKVVTRWED